MFNKAKESRYSRSRLIWSPEIHFCCWSVKTADFTDPKKRLIRWTVITLSGLYSPIILITEWQQGSGAWSDTQSCSRSFPFAENWTIRSFVREKEQRTRGKPTKAVDTQLVLFAGNEPFRLSWRLLLFCLFFWFIFIPSTWIIRFIQLSLLELIGYS